MSDDTMKVTLTLRRGVAERLRRICYAQNTTASNLVDRWVLSWFDEDGKPKKMKSNTQDCLEQFFGSVWKNL